MKRAQKYYLLPSSHSFPIRVCRGLHYVILLDERLKLYAQYMVCFKLSCACRFFVSFLLNIPVFNFSVMSGLNHRFLCITSTFVGVNASCSRTHGDPSEDRTPRPLATESDALPLGHRAPMLIRFFQLSNLEHTENMSF